MCTGSCRSPRLSVVAIWNHVGKSVVWPLHFLQAVVFSGSAFLFLCFSPTTPPFFLFPLSSQCDRCLDVPMWGLKAGLQGLLAMRAFYRLGAG